MKTITVRVVAKPQVEDNTPTASTAPSFDRKTGVALVQQMNAFIDKHNGLVDAMNKVVNMDEDEFSPEKAVGLMTSLIRTSMQLQIFIDKVDDMDDESLEPMIGHACNLLNNFTRMIEDLQELFDESTGFASDIEYCGDEEDEDDVVCTEEEYRMHVAKAMSDVISCTNQEIDNFCAADKFDLDQAESLLAKARRFIHDLNETIENATEDGYADVEAAAAESKAELKARIKKLKLLIAENDEE